MFISKKSVVAATASAVLLFGTMAPLAFAEELTISGNGQSATSAINVSSPQTTTVTQSNSAAITNNVTAEASSGSNHANGNTGGSVTVGTGAASSTVNVTNRANVNIADPNSCCNNQNGSVTISGNGEKSTNTANLTAPNTHTTSQTNTAAISNTVNNEASSGENHANGNTGGPVSITAGAATSNVTLNNMANANISGKSRGVGTGAGTLSVKIMDNGKSSVNTIALLVPQTTTLAQNNAASFSNSVDAEAESGGNHANGNTGGPVSITAGAATSMVDITNAANFNSADIDCGCLLNLTAKIDHNGELTTNTINATMGNTLALGQSNGGPGFSNTVTPEASSGDNQANSNTEGSSSDDPSITTQAANSTVTLNNSGNANVAGSSPRPIVILPGGTSLSFSFDFAGLSALLSMLGLH